jgi:hypothetical protein
MFVHCFKLQILDQAILENVGLGAATNNASVRINICRTGVVNFFVGLPGGIPMSFAPEMSALCVCQMLLDSIMGAT